MNPKDIHHRTMLDDDYAADLKAVKSGQDFTAFLAKYDYWLDAETKELTGENWEELKPLLRQCRREGTIPQDKHLPALALLMPARIFRVSIVASKFMAPWGCAYKRLKEIGKIDY